MTFFSAVILVGASLLFPTLPLRLVYPPAHRKIAQFCKTYFVRALLYAFMILAPSDFVMSFSDADGVLLDPREYVSRDAAGRVNALRMPDMSVWISNHQIYTDWVYIWFLAYYANLQDHMFIVLKDSLRKIPIVGPGMELFHFIFLSRNWGMDRALMEEKLADVAATNPEKLSLLIFPEGTNFSKNQYSKATQFADKMKRPHPRHALLPRSTGLLFCLQSLEKNVPQLHIVDLTIAYTGTTSDGYPAEWFTIASQLITGVSPPMIHVHCEVIPVPDVVRIQPHSDADEMQIKAQFEQWLFARWEAKERLLAKFYEDGDFVSGAAAHSSRDESGANQPFARWSIGTRSGWLDLAHQCLIFAGPAIVAGYGALLCRAVNAVA
ncbi:hypothetical protein MSPP1_002630 [Malassezia sp. CBS 17886]|nr:hypothetical protein MSPP1_002630 [Malassezia sp. CBS 17886]